jgi:hypothetical protein
MNSSLLNALSAIKRAGGYKIPSAVEVEEAPNGKKWYGEKKDGAHWMLIKHRIDSYNVTC